MADTASDFKLGEFRDDADNSCELVAVELAGTVAAGDLLKITGANTTTGLLKVEKHTAKTSARYVVPTGQGGVSGDIKQVLRKGVIKVTFGSAVAVGAPIYAKGNKIVSAGTSDLGNLCGINAGPAAAADDDTGLVYFVGYAI